jgi:hypothetical protein
MNLGVGQVMFSLRSAAEGMATRLLSKRLEVRRRMAFDG